MPLEAYKDIVATCAAISTMGQMLSGTIICKNIYCKGSAKGFDPMPFVGGIGLCLLMLQYAVIVNDPAMINVNVFGLVTNVIYTLVFYIYSPDKAGTVSLLGKTAGFVAIFLGYAQVENAEVLEFRYGIIITVLFLVVIALPLINLGEIIRTKSTEILPFPMIFMGTLVSFQWLLYGIIIENTFIIFQNTIGFVLSLAQLSLFVIFPSTPIAAEKLSKKDQ